MNAVMHIQSISKFVMKIMDSCQRYERWFNQPGLSFCRRVKAFTWILIYMNAHLHVCSFTCMLIYMYAHLHVCSFTCMLIYMYAHLHVCSFTWMLIYMNALICIVFFCDRLVPDCVTALPSGYWPISSLIIMRPLCNYKPKNNNNRNTNIEMESGAFYKCRWFWNIGDFCVKLRKGMIYTE